MTNCFRLCFFMFFFVVFFAYNANSQTDSTFFNSAHATNAQNTSDQLGHLSYPTTSQDKAVQLLASKDLWFILLGFLGFGLLLAFTPCVLPMIPILASIIVGQGQKITMSRAFGLSLTYVLSMAFTYSIAGVVAGLAGSYVQAYLQNPWVLSIFSLIFVLLALSLLGLYDFRMPPYLQTYFISYSHQQKRGTYTGVAIMGCLATLIGSPCVTAPLVGVLSYIGETGNAWLGGCALFLIGLGMGIPLLIVGTLGGSFLPKAGDWLNSIKTFFGLILLGIAIWFLARILPDYVIMLLCSALAILTSVYMRVFEAIVSKNRLQQFIKGLGFVVLVYGLSLALGVFMGNDSYLRPLQMMQVNSTETAPRPSISWEKVNSLPELQKALTQAKIKQKPVIVDFYADWCVSCQDMVNQVFIRPEVEKLLNKFIKIRADITNNTQEEIALMHYFHVISPPTFMFFNKKGEEMKTRVIDEENAKEFSKTLQQILFHTSPLQRTTEQN